MKKLFFVACLLSVFVISSYAADKSPAPSPWLPDGSGGITTDRAVSAPSVTMGSAASAIPATGVLTTVMHKNGVLNDSALTGATDVQLLDIEQECSFKIRISTGTYGISLKPPTGETLIMISTALDANDEIDLSSTVFDEFVIERMAYGAGYVYVVTPVRGSVSDGGVS